MVASRRSRALRSPDDRLRAAIAGPRAAAAGRAAAPRAGCAGALLALVLAVLPAAVPRAQAAGNPVSSTLPITLTARSSEYRNNSIVFQGVKIQQGGMAVEAEHATATGLDFQNSKWTFSGNVKITMPDGSLASDEARVNFAKNELASALITGRPASFQQQREKGVARGRADRIEYDFEAGTVRLTDGAWLSDGANEINGRTLVYSMKDQRILAAAAEQKNQKVVITINPQKKPDAKTSP